LVILAVDNQLDQQSTNDSRKWLCATATYELSNVFDHSIPRALPKTFMALPQIEQVGNLEQNVEEA
jgi:hypothetical protein